MRRGHSRTHLRRSDRVCRRRSHRQPPLKWNLAHRSRTERPEQRLTMFEEKRQPCDSFRLTGSAFFAELNSTGRESQCREPARGKTPGTSYWLYLIRLGRKQLI